MSTTYRQAAQEAVRNSADWPDGDGRVDVYDERVAAVMRYIVIECERLGINLLALEPGARRMLIDHFIVSLRSGEPVDRSVYLLADEEGCR